ncbi:outer membrane protein assembly factor BamB family protein [Adhaeretor mobilis]|uniref:Outer membrane biogenesis protein BamB n=1 Tax=Adhaeretor mobilis TaxID=1930276 RepID=A0A517MPG1_9BACT|nr:PQQ-binding-like beta-propeller repeat protein [Adhaeretor mobilis]QDS96752.1 outer membrane biogenesis protein BamB [Adhaeretor mobilis]
MKSLALSTCLVLLLSPAVAADTLASAEGNWPQWRGAADNSIAALGDYPVEFSAEQNLLWKIELPGRGSSTPAVWGEHIFVTCEEPVGDDNQLDTLVCYNWASDELWKLAFGPGKKGKHRNGSGSNPSPVTDGKHVVAYYKSGRVVCCDFTGQKLWEKNIQDLYGKDTLWWDLGTSPVLAGDKVIIAVMQAGDSYIVAFDLSSGDEAWKTPRQYDRPKESDQAYTTPQVIQQGGVATLVTWGADHLTGHDVQTGEQLWECGGFNPEEKGMWRVIASAAVDGDFAVVPYGRAEHLAAISLEKTDGDITDDAELWRRHGLGADCPTPIIDGQRIYVLGDKGDVYALDRQTGETLWKDRLPRSGKKYFASPTLANGKLYCTREEGMVFVVEVDEKGMELLAENNLGESLIATPVAVRDKILIRGEEHLFLFGNDSEK